MIQFLILLVLSPVLIPMFALVCAVVGMAIGLWFGAFLLFGIYQVFLNGWGE